MFRYPGSKWNESAYIAKYINARASRLVVPFFGSGAVWRRLMAQGRSFAAVHVYDLDELVVRFWSSVKDGSHVENLISARAAFCPENENENEIRSEFARSKEVWRATGDPFAWFFLRLYALGQFVMRPHGRTCFRLRR